MLVVRVVELVVRVTTSVAVVTLVTVSVSVDSGGTGGQESVTDTCTVVVVSVAVSVGLVAEQVKVTVAVDVGGQVKVTMVSEQGPGARQCWASLPSRGSPYDSGREHRVATTRRDVIALMVIGRVVAPGFGRVCVS